MQHDPSSARNRALREGHLGTVLSYRIAKASVAVDEVFERQVGQMTNLKPIEFSLLALAQSNVGAGPARLAEAVGISRPRATQLLDHLTERGLVKRVPNAADGRSLEIHVTPSGNQLVREGLRRLQTAERAATTCLSEAEFGILIELLARIASVAAVE